MNGPLKNPRRILGDKRQKYIHFLLQEDDIFIDKNLAFENKNEKKINKITAEFLIPTSHVKELWDNNSTYDVEQVAEHSKLFNVSKLAVAIKLNAIGKIGQHTVNKIKQETETGWQSHGSRSGGGNYYHTNRSRFGNNFIRTVIQGTESGDISYTYAFDLLDGSVKAYNYFKEEIMGYGG